MRARLMMREEMEEKEEEDWMQGFENENPPSGVVGKISFSVIWGSHPMVPMVSFKETMIHGRGGFSMGGHSLVGVTLG